MEVVLESISSFFASSYRGIDESRMSEGGLKCYQFLTITERMVDTLAYVMFALIFVTPRVVRTLSLSSQQRENINTINPNSSIVGLRKILLVIIYIVFGFEMGYKVMRETWIHILNVCHVITMAQIYLQCSTFSIMYSCF